MINLPGIKTAEIPQDIAFATKPFISDCVIVSIKAEETKNGTKYLNVELRSKDGIVANGTYWLPNGLDAKKDDWKLGKIKELLVHAGANMALPEDKLVESIIGKTLNCAFQSEEYIGNENGAPVRRTKVTLRFTNPKGKAFPEYVNEDYLTKKLSNEDWGKLTAMQNAYNKSNPGAAHSAAAPALPPLPTAGPAAAAPLDEDDDLPF